MELPPSLKHPGKKPGTFFGEKTEDIEFDFLSRFIKMKVMAATRRPVRFQSSQGLWF